MVVNRLNRDLFWRAVELLTDPDRKKARRQHATWLKPGLVGRVRYLWRQQRAQTCHSHELLAGRRTILTAGDAGDRPTQCDPPRSDTQVTRATCGISTRIKTQSTFAGQ